MLQFSTMTSALGLPGTFMPALKRDKRMMRTMLANALEAAGGQERLNEFASANDANYLEVLKLAVRSEPKDVNVAADDSVEALIEALDRRALPRPAHVVDVESFVVDEDDENDDT